MHICVKRNKPIVWAVLLMVFFSSFSGVLSADQPGLFTRIRQSAENQAENLKDRDWWITTAARSAAGSIGGYAVGAVGAGIGYMIGAGMGGPILAGTGAVIGYRIARLIGQTFMRAVGEIIARRKLESGESISPCLIKDAFKSVSIGSLSFESLGRVVGDFAGAALGAAAGIAFLSGMGCIAVPVLGTFSAAFIGAKLGSMIGGSIGRSVTGFTFRKGYEVISERRKNRETEEISPKSPQEPEDKDKQIEENDTFHVSSAYDKYVEAYHRYLRATNSGADSQTVQKRLDAYRNAYNNYLTILNQAQ